MYPPELVKQWEADYNEMARVWNSLPGSKLKWPEDKFKVHYCTCKREHRTTETKYGLACQGCGFLIGE